MNPSTSNPPSSIFHPDQIEFTAVPATVSHADESNSLRHDDLFQLVNLVKTEKKTEEWTLRNLSSIHPLPKHISSNTTQTGVHPSLFNSFSQVITKFIYTPEIQNDTHSTFKTPKAPQLVLKLHPIRLTTAVIYKKILYIYSKPFENTPYHQINVQNPTSIEWVPMSNDTLLVGTQTGPLLYTQLHSATPICIPLVYPLHNNIQDVSVNRQGMFAATISTNSPYLVIWDLMSQVPHPILMTEKPQRVMWSPNGKYLAIVQYDQITILDPSSFESYPLTTDPIHCVSWNPDSQSLVYSSPDENRLKIIQILPLASHIQLTQLASISLDSIPSFKPPTNSTYRIESISINSKSELAIGYSAKSYIYPCIHVFKIQLDYINYYSTTRNQIFEFIKSIDYDSSDVPRLSDISNISNNQRHLANLYTTAQFHPTMDNQLWVQFGESTIKCYGLN